MKNYIKKIIYKISKYLLIDVISETEIIKSKNYDYYLSLYREIINSGENNKIELGRLNRQMQIGREKEILKNIQKAEFKVFSQWGDDGIIQFLINYLEIKNKTFVEFGVENYRESNTRFLLINDNWTGLVFDCSENYINEIKASELYWKYDLIAAKAFITRENINSLITMNGFKGEVGILHIDLDGNDYWIWKAIDVISPSIVIMEYVSVLGIENPYTIPYSNNFTRSEYHYTQSCYGSSLLSLCDLAKEKGYTFVGSNSAGNNAYFVKNSIKKDLKELTVEEGYVKSKFREARDKDGNLSFVRDNKRREIIKGCKVYNTRTNKIENFK